MDELYTDLDRVVPLQGMLGYLNFSEGKPDPRFQKQLGEAYAFLTARGLAEPWHALRSGLADKLRELHDSGSAAFREAAQAETVLALVFDQVLPAYRRHHADLLVHQSDRELFQPFFLARVFEAVLAEGGPEGSGELLAPSEENPRLLERVLTRLNDFVGYRPVATLERRDTAEIYYREKVRPIPLFLRGVGAAPGRYHDLVARALDILRGTDPTILADASFDPELLDELALDPRAYDHGHPANRRPNYVFGEWDPHHLDNQGRFRRFVVRQVTLDALIEHLERPGDLAPREALDEAATVLAGTVLMAAGVSGWGPGAHDSGTTLATLIPRIARYREAFYARQLERSSGTPHPPPQGGREEHAARLHAEAERTRQPFGGTRQRLNQTIARQRAAQLQQRQLALVFAEMGYPDASRFQAAQISAASTRMLSEIHGRLTTGAGLVERGDVKAAAAVLPEVEDLIRRGIACGALADPWNILGFQGLFPLDRAQEDAVRDTRIDDLIMALERLFELYARLLSEVASRGQTAMIALLLGNLNQLANWWDRYASFEVHDVRPLRGSEIFTSASSVATCLFMWHDRGQAAGDLAFWREHLELLGSPKAFALVIDALLAKEDDQAAMALLMTWLGQSEQVALEDGEYSFHTRALRWMLGRTMARRPEAPAGGWPLVKKFFDYLEANAEEYWQVPALDIDPSELPMPRQQEGQLFEAAYEGMTYRDTADDDQDSALAEAGPDRDGFALDWQAELLEERLTFLTTVARLWQIAARADAGGADRAEVLGQWLLAARHDRDRLLALLDAVHDLPIPEPIGTQEALVEYDRRRVLKDNILGIAIGAGVEMTLAVYALRGVLPETEGMGPDEPAWGPATVRLERALLQGDADSTRALLPEFMQAFRLEPLLFPADGGGHPRQVLRVRVAQNVLRALVVSLPRLGLLGETLRLLREAHAMEQQNPPAGRGRTEFNQVFQIGYQAVVRTVVESSAAWGPAEVRDGDLVRLLEELTGPFLALWVEHSQTLHLSVLETIRGGEDWDRVREFVRRYGGGFFHAKFMTLANLRGILHRGAGAYLDYLRENADPLHPMPLAEDLDRGIPRAEAIRVLELVLRAVLENYEEYKDYNTSTTQSDYGENLHVFLDFLLLKTSYERWAWHFRPLNLTHDVFTRWGRHGAAVRWQEALARLTRDLARQHLERLEQLEHAHGMVLRTVRDRLEEQFVRGLALDRLCALVRPVMEEAGRPAPGRSFTRFEQELRAYAENPAGVGLDVPPWLRRLESEVHHVRAGRHALATLAEDFLQVPRRLLSEADVRAQVEDPERGESEKVREGEGEREESGQGSDEPL